MDGSVEDNLQPTRKRVKLSGTSEHIYETLFEQEQNSDVTIVILGKRWKLHKAILKQSLYFAGMFSGSWKESEENVIDIPIDDANITHDSVKAVLGSFYSGEIELGVDNVVSILATAALLQVQHVIDKCSELMSENISCKTATVYYNAATAYGANSIVIKNTREWLETNLIWCSGKNYLSDIFFKDISVEFMKEIVSSSNLIVFKNEHFIYLMLRKWLAVHVGKSEDESTEDFYKRQTWPVPFLMTEEGAQYKLPFESLRLEHLIVFDQIRNFINSSNLIPDEWMNSCYKKLWQSSYLIPLHRDSGPAEKDNEYFYPRCLRFGYLMKKKLSQDQVIVLEAYQFSMDFFIAYSRSKTCFELKRLPRDNGVETNIFRVIKATHNILIRLSLISIDENRQVKHAIRTPILHFSLGPNDTVKIMDVDEHTTYPLYVGVQWMTVTP